MDHGYHAHLLIFSASKKLVGQKRKSQNTKSRVVAQDFFHEHDDINEKSANKKTSSALRPAPSTTSYAQAHVIVGWPQRIARACSCFNEQMAMWVRACVRF
jgi:hypothetical protein